MHFIIGPEISITHKQSEIKSHEQGKAVIPCIYKKEGNSQVKQIEAGRIQNCKK
jgi:hypothetical protein